MIDTTPTIDDIFAGMSLMHVSEQLLDWAEHDGSYAVRTVGSKKSPKGHITFISGTEFQRVKADQQLIWNSSMGIVEEFLGKF